MLIFHSYLILFIYITFLFAFNSFYMFLFAFYCLYFFPIFFHLCIFYFYSLLFAYILFLFAFSCSYYTPICFYLFPFYSCSIYFYIIFILFYIINYVLTANIIIRFLFHFIWCNSKLFNFICFHYFLNCFFYF